jgi:DNA/RNA non-specific endonuclease/Bacterial TSP3 repeat
MRGQRGQTAAEYLGALLVISVIVAAIATTTVGELIGSTVRSLVCEIAQRDCSAEATARAAARDSDGDGLTDGEEAALGTNPRDIDSDDDGIGDRTEYDQGTDPAQAILPLTDENYFTPWVRVGLTEDEWRTFEDKILEDIEPGGVLGFLAGPSYSGVTLNEDGELELIEIQEMGVNPFKVVKLLGAGASGLKGTGSIVRAAGALPATARAALAARGIIPSIARIRPPVPPLRPGVVASELDSLGRTTGAAATITRRMLGTGTSASRSVRPAGFAGGQANHARGHLIARQLGGSGRDPRNLVTLYQNPVNTPVMRGFEQQVANAVRAGQTVRYEALPIYRGSELIPRAITLRATGNRGFRLNVTILNHP